MREFGTYAERRSYIREMYRPLLERIDERSEGAVGSELPGSELPGWPAVDAQVAQLGIRLASAATPEDHQAVGLLCRDIMISLAQAAHDVDNLGYVGSSAVDQLYAVVDDLAAGQENEKLRRLLKTTIDFANVVQHRRGVSPGEAGLIAEATVAAVNLVRRLVDTDRS